MRFQASRYLPEDFDLEQLKPSLSNIWIHGDKIRDVSDGILLSHNEEQLFTLKQGQRLGIQFNGSESHFMQRLDEFWRIYQSITKTPIGDGQFNAVIIHEDWYFSPSNPNGKCGFDKGQKICVYPLEESGHSLYFKTFDFTSQRGNYIDSSHVERFCIDEVRRLDQLSSLQEQIGYLRSLDVNSFDERDRFEKEHALFGCPRITPVFISEE